MHVLCHIGLVLTLGQLCIRGLAAGPSVGARCLPSGACGFLYAVCHTEPSITTNALSRACRQLEILHNSDTGAEHGSLLWLLDHTMTVFGGRLLRSWVAHPLRDAAAVQERLDAVQELAEATSERLSNCRGTQR